MKVICDTTVWYNIGENKALEEKVKSQTLVCTYPTISEIIYSRKNIKQPEKPRLALQAIQRLSKECYLHVPFEHFLLLDDVVYKPKYPKQINSDLEIMKLFAEGLNLDEEGKKYFKQDSDSMLEFKRKIMDAINAELLPIQKRINKNNMGQHLSQDMTTINRKLILSWISAYAKNEYSPKNSEIWTRLEFFCEMLTLQFKKLETTKGMKFEENDLFDLLIMIYVQPGDRFWTADTRWLKLFTLADANNLIHKYRFD